MPEELRIGFWNVQRYAQTNIPRTQRVEPVMTRWLKGFSRGGIPDVVALCEVGAGGQAWANEDPNYWTARGFNARFVSVPSGNSTGISPCSFMVARRVATTDQINVRTVGASTVRPMVQITPSWTRATIVACHLKASRDIARDELETFLQDIRAPAGTVLYGDLNFDFETAPQEIRTNQGGAAWQKVSPGLEWSFVSRSSTDLHRRQRLIDFAYSNDIALVPQPPYPRYNLWKTIDHAPIEYQLRGVTRARDAAPTSRVGMERSHLQQHAHRFGF